jgi:hypothetical protein
LTAAPALAIVNGSGDIATVIGASRFYAAGYDGSGVVAINVDGGHGWTSHETLTATAQLLDARPFYTANGFAGEIGQLGSFDFHATWTAHALAGRGSTTTQRGIAYGATLWSGAIATSFVQGTTSWSWNRGAAFTYPYAESMLVGRAGLRADVINSSWGFSDPGGNNIWTWALDGMARSSGATTVFAAGNNGTNTSLFWGSPGGYNGIIVGALASGNNEVASFSSRGPVDYAAPNGAVVPAARARVDLVAPGQGLTLARYGGTTGSNAGGSDPTNGATNLYNNGVFGTSAASAIVAGAATLLVDMAYDRFAGNSRAHDGEVIKAVLLNSARKITGWSNGQTTDVNGVVRTTQALDFVSGAGALDLNAAFDQFGAGTTDLAGTNGGTVQAVGWDYGSVAQNATQSYSFAQALAAGERLDATLNWFVGRSYVATASDGSISANDNYFTDLALQVWRTDAPGGARMVAESNAAYLNTEHLSFLLSEAGLYQLRVVWMGERYDFVNNGNQAFGLAWNVTPMPEPAAALLMLVGAVLLRWRVVRRSEG